MNAGVAATVLRRDRGCVAPLVDPLAGPCHNQWGRIMTRTEVGLCERDHIEGRNRAKVDDAREIVMICPGHHRGAGEQGKGGAVWSTANRPLLRLWARGEFRAESARDLAANP